LYVSGLGIDAFGTAVERPGRSLPTVQTSRSFDDLTKRNRSAVDGWLVRETVNL
jgi:hypothetical protein